MVRDLITRTISGTKVTAKIVNPITDEISRKEIMLSKVVTDAEKVKKLVVRQLDPSTEVLIHVEATEKIDKLFGISVADFMAHAVELDPATRALLKSE